MKKIKIISVIFLCLLICGCSFKDGKLSDATIRTTVYPVEFITDYLYGDSSTITSIYPSDVDIDSYNLTDKQINEYASSDLFVYIGLGKEKEIAKTFVNNNNDLLIIDATYGLNYNYDIRELWLAPNNFLMLAKNIKNSLNEYLDNTLREENVEKKYNELYAEISWIDAELRNIAKEAIEINNNTLVVSSNVFKFLESYGFNIISLEDIQKSESALTDLKNKFKNSNYTTIIKTDSENESDLIKELVDKYKANVVNINDTITNSDESSNYIDIQNTNLVTYRNVLIK